MLDRKEGTALSKHQNMVFYPLRYLKKKMSHAKDPDRPDEKEVEIDWNDPFQRVKFFYEYCSPDGDKVHSSFL